MKQILRYLVFGNIDDHFLKNFGSKSGKQLLRKEINWTYSEKLKQREGSEWTEVASIELHTQSSKLREFFAEQIDMSRYLS